MEDPDMYERRTYKTSIREQKEEEMIRNSRKDEETMSVNSAVSGAMSRGEMDILTDGISNKFDVMDANGDGVITREEFMQFELRNSPPSQHPDYNATDKLTTMSCNMQQRQQQEQRQQQHGSLFEAQHIERFKAKLKASRPRQDPELVRKVYGKGN